MSVDTNTTGKNLAPYDKVRHPEFTILVSPVLSGMVSRMRVVARGRFVKSLGIEFGDWPAGSDGPTASDRPTGPTGPDGQPDQTANRVGQNDRPRLPQLLLIRAMPALLIAC